MSPIDSSGLFHFEIYPVVAREFSLTPIQDRLLVAPGDSLFIEHDFTDIMNTRLSGRGGEVNNRIAQFRNTYLGRYTFDYETPYHVFKELCDQQLKETLEKIEEFQHYTRTREAFNNRDAYYSFIPELEQTIDETMVLTDYFWVTELLNMLTLHGNNPVPKARDIPLSPKEAIHALYSSGENPFLSQFAVVSHVSIETRANLTQTIDEEEEVLHQLITDPFLRAAVQDEYNRVKDYLANPRIYSDAVMGNNQLETSGTGVHFGDSAHVVKQVIEDNPGKALYVDVWAPWCYGCMIEMEDSKKLSEHFADDRVTFVYLCMGGSREQWKETIRKYDLAGVHLYLTEKEWINLMKRFHIKSISHYLLFNQEGVMIDFGGHLRPSIPETRAAIERALIQ